MSARFTIESTTAFGVPPPLVGHRPASLPDDVLRTLSAASTAMHPPDGPRPNIPQSAVLEVLAAETLGIEWRAYAARAPWDEDLFWLIGTRTGTNGERLQVVSAAGGACELEPLHPAISSCVTPGGSGWVASLGRLAPNAVRVEAITADGSATRAIVENDWWFLSLDDQTARTLLDIRAFDANGDIVGHLAPRDAAIGPGETARRSRPPHAAGAPGASIADPYLDARARWMTGRERAKSPGVLHRRVAAGKLPSRP